MVHSANIRNKKDLHVPFCKYKISVESPDIFGLTVFNRLPDDLKLAKPLNSFKSKLKEFLVNKCLYSVNEYIVP